jgi:hypothetical protein
MSTDGHGLWASLPEELTHKIVEYVGMYWDLASWVPGQRPLKRTSGYSFDDVLECRRLNRAFAAGLWPVALCIVPVDHRHHARCFVEGVVRHAIDGMMTGDRLAELYTCVYEGCTQPYGSAACKNWSQGYYDQLSLVLGPMLQKLLGDRRLSHQEKRTAVGRMRYIFTYLDRWFVERHDLKRVRELIAEAFGYQEEGAAKVARETVVWGRGAAVADSSDEDEESSDEDSSDEDEDDPEVVAAELQA